MKKQLMKGYKSNDTSENKEKSNEYTELISEKSSLSDDQEKKVK